VNKIFAVAEQEFRSLVRSKAFLISIVLLPLMMVLGSVMQRQLGRRTDTRPRRFAVIDPSGRWFDALAARAEARNQHLGALKHDSLAPFVPVRVDGSRPLDELRLQLSAEVKKEQLFAFVEIAAEPDAEPLRYYTEHPAVDDLPNWLSATVDDVLRTRRYALAKLDDATIKDLQRHVGEVERLGLFTRDPDGRVHPAERLDIIKSIVVPMVPPFLLFFFVVVSTPQLMNSVLTEKMSRISEVLLGSVSPFELMAGKLLGSVAVSLLLGAVYLGGGVMVAARMGYASAIPPSLLAWFLVFLVLAMLLYGSISIAIGAACTDLKDAQNLMLPVMLPIMLPMFMMSAVVESPSSSLATGLSIFPFSAPLTMMLRVGLHPSAPLWQVGLAALLMLATALGCIWAAGRIFRVGLLMQGKSASLGQMARWIFSD
jgi:ABC-2 type transport system permease protein